MSQVVFTKGAAAKLRAVNCVAGCVWFTVPEPTEWQRIGKLDWRHEDLYAGEVRKRAFCLKPRRGDRFGLGRPCLLQWSQTETIVSE